MTTKPSLGRLTLQGLAWLSFQSASGRIVSLVSQLALAYLLLPADFGVISLVYAITSIAQTLTSFGIDSVLLQRHRTLRLWIATAFWTSLALGLLGFLAVAVMAPLFAVLYGTPEITRLAVILAVSMPLGALATVPEVKMRSDLNFRFLAVYSTAETTALQAATIALAWAGFGAPSFVLATPVFALIRAAVYWRHAPIKFGGAIRPKQAAFLLGNGLAVFGARLCNEVVAQGDYAVLALVASKDQVGLYFFAFRLSAQPVWILAGNFMNVLLPALVQLRSEPARQLEGALRAARLLSFIVMPVCFLQAALIDPGLRLFFGEHWLGSIVLAQIMSIGLPFGAVNWIGGALLGARRDYRRGLLYASSRLPAFFLYVGLGALLGRAEGVAIALMAYHMTMGPLFAAIVFARYGARPADILPLYVTPPILAAVAMGAAYIISTSPPFASAHLLRIVEIGVVGPLLYAMLLWLFERGVLTEVAAKLGVGRLLHATT